MKSKKYSDKEINRLRGIWYRLFPNLDRDMIEFRLRLVSEGCPVDMIHRELNILSHNPKIDIVIPPEFDFEQYLQDNVLTENKLFE